MSELALVDVGALVRRDAPRGTAADAIDRACREQGFFYVVGHGVEEALYARLERACRAFFARAPAEKLAFDMARGGRAWRGYFPVGRELTLGRPDVKEGLYFGAELGREHPRVRAGLPLHGPNLFPDVPDLRAAVLAWMQALTRLGHALMEGLALGLGLAPSYFAEHGTREPLTLLRVFHYPPLSAGDDAWSVAEHTDYGLLTILRQDDIGGLEVRTPSGWIAAPPVPGAFLCNLGDMLERMTGGHYRSTAHRVRNTGARGRLSVPFFFDPDFEARVRPIDLAPAKGSRPTWDGIDPHAFEGTYGDYLVRKLARVFPELGRELLGVHDTPG